jgi:hypothetical protein
MRFLQRIFFIQALESDEKIENQLLAESTLRTFSPLKIYHEVFTRGNCTRRSNSTRELGFQGESRAIRFPELPIRST